MEGIRQLIEQGWTVIGSDGGKVGAVTSVREDHLVVEHGTLAKHDLYIPIDALRQTENDRTVALNVPARQVETQGWRYRPQVANQ